MSDIDTHGVETASEFLLLSAVMLFDVSLPFGFQACYVGLDPRLSSRGLRGTCRGQWIDA